MSRIIFIRIFIHQTKTEQISSQLQFVINLNLTRTTILEESFFFSIFIYSLVEVAFLVAAVLLAF